MHKSVFIKTTEACQLNCRHCFTTGSKPPRTFLDVKKTLDWVERFVKHFPNDSFHFELHGGEPFLAPVETLNELVDGIRRVTGKKVSVGATSNLTYKLEDDLLEFITTKLDSFGTSWDNGIRFTNTKQELLWLDNLQKVIAKGIHTSLNVSVSTSIVQMDQKTLLRFLRTTGCQRIQFERITANGSANEHLDLFPSNEQINQWYLDLHKASEELGARDWFNNAALESVYAKFETGAMCNGTFCRNCEESIFTVNADGTIGACPNGAVEEKFSTIDQSIEQMLKSSQRLDLIVQEKTPNINCFGCPVYSYCGGDCHRLQWQGDVCASPKQLMLKLAGLDYIQQSVRKRFIPIKEE